MSKDFGMKQNDKLTVEVIALTILTPTTESHIYHLSANILSLMVSGFILLLPLYEFECRLVVPNNSNTLSVK